MTRLSTEIIAAAMEGVTQAQRIAIWQNAQTSLVHAAGYEQASWSAYSNFGGDYTIIQPALAFRQSGQVKSVVIRINANNPAVAWKFKVFRWNAGTSKFDLVGEESFSPGTITSATTYTLNLATAISVQIGDVPGLYLNGKTVVTDNATAQMRYVAGDITASDAFSTTAARTFQMECFANPPFVAVTGDSLMEGHDGATPNHGGLDAAAGTTTIPWPVASVEIPAQIKALIGSGSVLKYQNLALGSQTYAWVASTGIVQCLAIKPSKVVILCGVNDVSAGRSWAQVSANLDTIAAAVAAASPIPKLYISEILPWSAGTDLQAATIRTWNASLATWCAANGAGLIVCHDAMGQVRVSTGEIDDLKTAYAVADGVHLTAAGVSAIAAIYKPTI